MQYAKSRELELKFEQLNKLFPNLFNYINPKDILFLREDSKDPIETNIDMIPINGILSYFTNVKIIIVITNKFDSLTINKQFMELANTLFQIPKDYKEEEYLQLRPPPITMFPEEEEIIEFLRKGFNFNAT